MTIGLIACCSKKNKEKINAQKMYQSPLFIKSFAYLQNRCDKTYILSAKYGLLNLEDIIEPYDLTLNEMKKPERINWANKVLEKLKKKTNINEDKYIILAGLKYRENIIEYLKNHEIPMQGLSIGRQLQFLKGRDLDE